VAFGGRAAGGRGVSGSGLGPVRALLFDFDGLILDTETAAYESWREVYEAHGCALSLDIWSKVYGGSGEEWDHIAHLEQQVNRRLDGEDIKRKRRERKVAMIEGERVCPGVEGLIRQAMEMDIGMAVVSSAGRPWVSHYLERHGLASRFGVIVCGEEGRAKPHPDLYLRALDLLGLEACECIALEDSPNGVRAARSAGIYCVAVPNRIARELQMDYGHANLEVTSLEGISLGELALVGA
jgi:HAD superfamily hydrolase (TIGR01509 family)